MHDAPPTARVDARSSVCCSEIRELPSTGTTRRAARRGRGSGRVAAAAGAGPSQVYGPRSFVPRDVACFTAVKSASLGGLWLGLDSFVPPPLTSVYLTTGPSHPVPGHAPWRTESASTRGHGRKCWGAGGCVAGRAEVSPAASAHMTSTDTPAKDSTAVPMEGQRSTHPGREPAIGDMCCHSPEAISLRCW